MSFLGDLRGKLESAAVMGCGTSSQANFKFVPNPTLEAIMSYETILQALRTINNLEPYQLTAHAELIQKDARKIFAILLLIGREVSILEFLRNELRDVRLPLRSKPDLESTFSDVAGQRLFLDQQWWFLAPEFFQKYNVIWRNFPVEMVMPFTKEEALGDGYSKGTSGQISKIRIHPLHQDFVKEKRSSRVSWPPTIMK